MRDRLKEVEISERKQVGDAEQRLHGGSQLPLGASTYMYGGRAGGVDSEL